MSRYGVFRAGIGGREATKTPPDREKPPEPQEKRPADTQEEADRAPTSQPPVLRSVLSGRRTGNVGAGAARRGVAVAGAIRPALTRAGVRPGLRAGVVLPISLAMMLRIFFKALQLCATRKVEWRGTSYTHRMTRKEGAPL